MVIKTMVRKVNIKEKSKSNKFGNIFLPKDYIDTLGMDIKKDKVMVIDFCGGIMKVKVKNILENGIMAEMILD
jgi:hypothetical protein